MYFDCLMLYVGYFLEKLNDVNAIIDNVVTSDRYTHVRYTIVIILGNDLFFYYIARTGRASTQNQRMCDVLSTYYGCYNRLLKTNPFYYVIQ